MCVCVCVCVCVCSHLSMVIPIITYKLVTFWKYSYKLNFETIPINYFEIISINYFVSIKTNFYSPEKITTLFSLYFKYPTLKSKTCSFIWLELLLNSYEMLPSKKIDHVEYKFPFMGIS